MLTRTRHGWELDERQATPEAVYLSRRQLAKAAIAGTMVAAAGGCMPDADAAGSGNKGLLPELYPASRNEAFKLDREITREDLVTTYNNFYEFGSSKRIAKAAEALVLSPWAIKIAGMVERPFEIDAEELIKKMPLEERLYRHRCVEAWSIAVPWSGFPLRALVEQAKPLGSAKYVKMVTFQDPEMAPGQRQFWYPWPYVEGLTMAEATHELAFIATGLYGKPIARSNGAPLRLVIPWKYGFKSVKSIVLFEFTDQRPLSFWEEIQGSEYGFWANVNPQVPHPRWSQATEEVLGTGERVPTQLYNGYAEAVAGLYGGLEGERLFM